jgi:hypothetical protein
MSSNSRWIVSITTFRATPSPIPTIAAAESEASGSIRDIVPVPHPPSHTPPGRPLDPRMLAQLFSAELMHAAGQCVIFTMIYCLCIFRRAIMWLQRPLSLLVFFWLLRLISPIFRAPLAPLCNLPGISRLEICFSDEPSPGKPIVDGSRHEPLWADFPRLLDVQTTAFERLFSQIAGGSGLSMEIKKAEIATSDLVTLVRASDLSSRELLADLLEQFTRDARRTARRLQRLNAKFNGGMDVYVSLSSLRVRC